MTDAKKNIVIANPVFQVKQSSKRNAKRLDCFALLAMTVYMERILLLVACRSISVYGNKILRCTQDDKRIAENLFDILL